MSSIVFKRLNSNDTGTYTCNARNVHGTDSITTKLVIQGLIAIYYNRDLLDQ